MPKRRRRKLNKKYRRVLVIISAVVLMLLLFTATLINKGGVGEKENMELIGLWRYDQYTEYEFKDGKAGCMCLDSNTHYAFTYSIKGNTLYIDFALDYVTDCRYTYTLEGNKLTLVGGEGTAEIGKEYVLTRIS